MTKYSKDIKLAMVQGYKPELVTQSEYARQTGVTKSRFQYWLRLYEIHGESAFTNGGGYTNYPVRFKLDVLNYMAQSGASFMDTAALFNLPDFSMLHSWHKKLETGGPEALEPKMKGRSSMKKDSKPSTKRPVIEGSVEALEERIKQLEMENEYLKKLNALVRNKEKSPNKTKHK